MIVGDNCEVLMKHLVIAKHEVHISQTVSNTGTNQNVNSYSPGDIAYDRKPPSILWNTMRLRFVYVIE